MTWMLYAAAAAVALAVADVFVKMSSGKVPNSLGVLLYGSVAFSVGLTWFLVDRVNGLPLRPSASGIASALGVGLSFSLVTVFLYAAFGAGAPLSVTSPVVRLGGLVVAGIAGLLIWNEPLTPRYAAGLLLSITGVYLIATR
ncbi:MAG TPA: EamA family transporter [Vicinamibacterales bacterium]|jgi:drug/metabolite transporter (DMT)-like permease